MEARCFKRGLTWKLAEFKLLAMFNFYWKMQKINKANPGPHEASFDESSRKSGSLWWDFFREVRPGRSQYETFSKCYSFIQTIAKYFVRVCSLKSLIFWWKHCIAKLSVQDDEGLIWKLQKMNSNYQQRFIFTKKFNDAKFRSSPSLASFDESSYGSSPF